MTWIHQGCLKPGYMRHQCFQCCALHLTGRALHHSQWMFRAKRMLESTSMLRVNRSTKLVGAGLLVMALSACGRSETPEQDPSRTVERPAGTDSIPAQQAGTGMHAGETGAMPADPAAADVEIRHSTDGQGVEVHKVDKEGAELVAPVK
ncbi:hypothetical protein [Stenotrophomonas sp.]|uniref:hypothetical protein n=1 Tax=Stenotrophomonas sp. TaxID=69392 RepID=UPI003D114DC8